MNRIESIIVFLIWIFFIIEGIHGGLNFPLRGIGNPNIEVQLNLKLALIFLPFFFFLIVIGFIHKRKEEKTIFAKTLDRIISEGAYERIRERLKFELLGALFFSLIGIIGSVKSIIIKAPEINFYLCLFPVSAGLGLLSGYLISKNRYNKKMQPTKKAG